MAVQPFYAGPIRAIFVFMAGLVFFALLARRRVCFQLRLADLICSSSVQFLFYFSKTDIIIFTFAQVFYKSRPVVPKNPATLSTGQNVGFKSLTLFLLIV